MQDDLRLLQLFCAFHTRQKAYCGVVELGLIMLMWHFGSQMVMFNEFVSP